jgi:hypothetical protein
MCARWAGRISLDSTSEKARQRITTQPIAAKNCPEMPVTSRMGRKAAMVVSTPNVAGTATLLTPSTIFSIEWPLARMLV